MQNVSVITPAFNSQDYIEQTYESLRRQSFDNWRWIVVDDCSTDTTAGVLKEIAKRDSRALVISNDRNLGAAHSRNRALQAADSDFVAFLDSDDLWRSDKLEKQIFFMQETGADASFTAYSILDKRHHGVERIVDGMSRGAVGYRDALRKRATIGCSTVMLNKAAIGDAKMPSIRTGQDYAFWLLLMRRGLQFHHLAEPLSVYRIRPGSISRNKFKKARRQWEIYRRLEKLSLADSTVNFAYYAIRAVFR